MRKSVITGVVALVVCAALTGCSEETKLSKAEYIKKGDAACRAFNEKLDGSIAEDLQFDEQKFGNDEQDLQEYVESVVDRVEAQEGQLNALEEVGDLKDPNDQKQMDSIFAKSKANAAKAKKLSNATKNKSEEAVMAQLGEVGLGIETSAQLAEFGFEECGMFFKSDETKESTGKSAADRGAQSNVRNALTAEKVYYTDNQAYSQKTTDLELVEPSLTYVNAVDDLDATGNVVYIAVSTTTDDDDTVTIGAKSSSGKCFWLRDVAGSDKKYSDDHSCAEVPADFGADAW